MKPFRFVIVGCGRMGLAHSARLASHPEATLVGFFDPDIEASRELQRRFSPDAELADSFEDLLRIEVLFYEEFQLLLGGPLQLIQLSAKQMKGRTLLTLSP